MASSLVRKVRLFGRDSIGAQAMNSVSLNEVAEYVDENIDKFYSKRLQCISGLQLSILVNRNPYLLCVRNIGTASKLVEQTMAAFLSSSEEKDFGDFLEGLAIFVAGKTVGGWKSSSPGLDLEFIRNGIHYIVSIKSSTSWDNSAQQEKLSEQFSEAITRLRQGGVTAEPILGMCYGKAKTTRNPKYGYLELSGQNFWTFISGDSNLYREIIEPIGYRPKEHDAAYVREYGRVTNRLTKEFIDKFCDATGQIDWYKVVEANSGNYDLDKQGLEPF
jgi:hypothetical protein